MARKFKIISLEQTPEDMLGWFEGLKSYTSFRVTRADKLIFKKTLAKADYRDYEHFVGVIGKFNPYQQFLTKPVEVSTLTYETLAALKVVQ